MSVEVDIMSILEKDGLKLYDSLVKLVSPESQRLQGLLEDLPAWG